MYEQEQRLDQLRRRLMISIPYGHQHDESVGNSVQSVVISTHWILIKLQRLPRLLLFEGSEEVGHGEYADNGGVGSHRQVANALLLHQRHGIG